MISWHLKNFASIILTLATFFTLQSNSSWAEIVNVIQQPNEQTIGVPIDRAIVVESAVPFSELSIANPAIADFSTLSDRTVYILGKLVGTTTLTLIDKKGNLISNVQIKVTTDLQELRKRIKQILPKEHIEVRSANDGIVLSGRVSSIEASEKAFLLASRYALGSVSNLIDVENLSRRVLITQTYKIEPNQEFPSSLFNGSQHDNLVIMSSDDPNFIGILSMFRSATPKTISYNLVPSTPIKIFVGNEASYPQRRGKSIAINNFKNGADISFEVQTINKHNGSIKMNIDVNQNYIVKDEAVFSDLTKAFKTQEFRSRQTIILNDSSSLLLMVAPSEINLQHNDQEHGNRGIRFFDQQNENDKSEIYAVHITLAENN